MKASYRWLASLLGEPAPSPEDVAERLTASGTEVEDLDPVGEDFVLDVGVTSNRPDCLCHLGLAREYAAITGAELEPPRYELSRQGKAAGDLVSVDVEDAEGCPRYTALVIEGVKVGPSPQWMQERLEAIGLRPVNNVVDATNYVLFELNQPLHAFDLDRLKGERIIVRRARAKESFQALNEKTYELRADDLVIADGERAVALAGVMGGLDSEVGEGTTRVLLESATFDPVTVRRTSRRLGLASDSSYRFERGVDRARVLSSSERAAALIVELAGGVVRPGEVDVGGDGPERASVRLRFERVERICGVSVAPERCRAVLEALNLEVLEADEASVLVKPPSWRADLEREIDLVEEVIRSVGLDEIPLEGGMKARIPRVPVGWQLRDRVKDWLVQLGFFECITPAFVGEGAPGECRFLGDGEPLRLDNPVRSEEPLLRRSLVPSLLQVRKHNYDQGNADCRLFEVSAVHFRDPKADEGSVPRHVRALGILLDGDLRDARGVVEALAERAGVVPRFEDAKIEGLEPGQQARIFVGEEPWGIMGLPSSGLLKAFQLKVEPVVVELDLSVLEREAVRVKTHRGLPRFPASERDLSLTVRERVRYGEIEAAIAALQISQLEQVSFFDLYRGKQVGEDRKSLALRLTFRDPARTLTGDEVDAHVARILETLARILGAEQRGA